MDDWIYIGEVDDFPKVAAAHCDTRDFHIIFTNETPSLNPIRECHIPKEIVEKSLFKREEILDWLKSLEEGSGGKKEWRMLYFNPGHRKAYGDWVKYIRFYRTDWDGSIMYFAYTTKGNNYYPLRRDVFIKENIL